MSRRLRTRLRANSALATPSLNLEFATAAGGLDSRVTFVRASTATFTGSNGLLQTAAIDAPRFDYDPVTLAPKGLLIEEQRTNLLLQSQFASGWLVSAAVLTANATASPEGNSNAASLADNATSGPHVAFQTVGITTSVTYAATVFAKAGTGRYLTVAAVNGLSTGSATATFDLQSGAVTQSGTYGSAATFISASATAVGNGWYRLTVISSNTTSNITVQVCGASAGTFTADVFGRNSYVGSGSTWFVYGAQLEAGAFATSYIPTVASQVTRTPDQTTMTSTNFSSWYNQSEGTFVTSSDCPALGGRAEMSVDDGSTANALRMLSQVTNPFFVARVAAANVAVLDGGTITANTPYTQANAYAANNYGVSVNGGTAVTSASGAVPTVNRMTIGWDSFGNYLNGHVRRIAYYNTRLADTTIQALSA